MPVGKKLVVVASLLATGVSTALFFRKDASQTEPRQEATQESPFRDRVERRVAAGAAWAQGLRARRSNQSLPVTRVPSATTAAITESKDLAQSQPIFQKSFHPVAALLEPIEDAPLDNPDDDNDQPLLDTTIVENGSATTHRVVDGDTLSRLAARYLGRGERYLEIFDLNRDVLIKPDLLPIGVTLRIPPRYQPPRAGGAPELQPTIPESTAPEDDTPRLEVVPLKPLGAGAG